MFILPWDDKYLTGIDMIDKQHKEIVLIVNMYALKFEKRYDYSELLNLLQEVENYASMHFQAEESYMSISAYPDYRSHAALHKQMSFELKRLNLMTRDKNIDLPAVTKEVVNFLSNWLNSHIIDEDQKFVQFCKERKQEG